MPAVPMQPTGLAEALARGGDVEQVLASVAAMLRTMPSHQLTRIEEDVAGRA